MADGTKIEWTDATWNIINGCSVVSPGCINCYAMRLAGTRLKHHPSREGLTRDTKAGPVWNGEVRWHEPFYRQPLAWTRPRRIFVCAHGDLFHDAVPDEWIDRVMVMAALCPQHTFQILTKRAQRMRVYFDGEWQARALAALLWMRKDPKPPLLSRHVAASYAFEHGKPLPNVHAGVSAEDQTRADERIPELLRARVAVRWVSAEPLLGPIDFTLWLHDSDCLMQFEPPGPCTCNDPREDHLDWIEVGGESGPGARPMRLKWVREIRDACTAAGVAFGFKQWGDWLPGEVYSKTKPGPDGTRPELGRVLDGTSGGHAHFPQFEAGQSAEEFRGRPTHWWRGDCWAGEISVQVGKHTAGRMLDGRTHDGLREART